jgi:hypothetical protein
MDILNVLKQGENYSKKELSSLLEQPTLSLVREGLYHCKNSESTLFFVDLEKKGKEERFHFDDFFQEDFFHWDSQTTQHINSPKIQEIVTGKRTPHLFVRITPKIKSVTQPFVYCGRLTYSEHEGNTSKPVHIVFQNIDYDDFTENEDLRNIYLWNPDKIGKTTKSKINKTGVVSKRRQQVYKRPNETERRGLVTSRVGQGFYRQQIVEKWNGTCPVSKSNIKQILISSHIVSWSESNDEERLDSENGILLSPNIDSLFDKHLISFEDNGNIIISTKINESNKESLGINSSIKIPVTEGMIKYLKRHRDKFNFTI